MELNDIELIKKYAKDNNELDRLVKEHKRLEEEIEVLQSVKIMSPVETKKLKELKKIKLAGRDKMEEIFNSLRQTT